MRNQREALHCQMALALKELQKHLPQFVKTIRSFHIFIPPVYSGTLKKPLFLFIVMTKTPLQYKFCFLRCRFKFKPCLNTYNTRKLVSNTDQFLIIKSNTAFVNLIILSKDTILLRHLIRRMERSLEFRTERTGIFQWEIPRGLLRHFPGGCPFSPS